MISSTRRQNALQIAAFFMILIFSLYLHELGHVLVATIQGSSVEVVYVGLLYGYIGGYDIDTNFLLGFAGGFTQMLFVLGIAAITKRPMLKYSLKLISIYFFIYAILEGILLEVF